MSSLPCVKVFELQFPSKLGRTLLVAEFLWNNLKAAVGTVHLESYGHQVKERKSQLEIAHKTLVSDGSYDLSLLMGDFNFASPEERSDRISEMKFQDIWTVLKPNDEGFSYDPIKNLMLKEDLASKGREHKAERIDLILYHPEANWKAEEVKQLGDVPFSTEPMMYPSDHFGIYGKLTKL